MQNEAVMGNGGHGTAKVGEPKMLRTTLKNLSWCNSTTCRGSKGRQTGSDVINYGNAQPSTTTVRGECDGGLGKKREEDTRKVVFLQEFSEVVCGEIYGI